MTLKPGRQKEYFMRVINRHFPQYAGKLESAYANDNRYGQPIWQQLPGNTMLVGHQICKKIGISDRSVRHTLPFTHEINYKVLGILLDIEFYQNYLMGLPWTVSKPFHELSVKIERGVEDLRILKEEGRLKQTLLIDTSQVKILEQIIDTGESDYLKNILARVQEESSGEQKLGIPSDEVID